MRPHSRRYSLMFAHGIAAGACLIALQPAIALAGNPATTVSFESCVGNTVVTSVTCNGIASIGSGGGTPTARVIPGIPNHHGDIYLCDQLNAGPFTFTFSVPVSRVRVALLYPNGGSTLQAFDAGNLLLGTATLPTDGNNDNDSLEISAAGITRVLITDPGTNFCIESLDYDLTQSVPGCGAADGCIPDNDGDGIFDDPDPDDDNDGVNDVDETDDFDAHKCRDLDADSCDDCSIGTDQFGVMPDFDVANDGTDTDLDGACDEGDQCPADPLKKAFGACGCGVADTDTDSDESPDCNDACPADGNKQFGGVCGCGVADTDSDSDETPDCVDACASDPLKVAAGNCGCGVPETDSDDDGTANCNDACPNDPAKTLAGACGCGVADTDSDEDGTPNCNDLCPDDSTKISVGACGCGVSDVDTDGDGTPSCNDTCPLDNPNDPDGDGVCTAQDLCVGKDSTGDADHDGICSDRDDRPLVAATSFTGELGPCTQGGVQLDLGLDENASGDLGAGEIDSTQYVCNGESSLAGTSPLVLGEELAPDPAVCPTGGVRLAIGFDANDNDALSADERAATHVICNELESLVGLTTLTSGDACPTGGVRIDIGHDSDGDGKLDADESDTFQNICLGQPALIATQEIASGDASCPSGGVAVETGVDENGDGTLDGDEVQGSEPVCDPAGLLLDVETIEQGDDACAHGGVRVHFGRDDGKGGGKAADGKLSAGETETSRDVCLEVTNLVISGGNSDCGVERPGSPGSLPARASGWLVISLALLRLRRGRRVARVEQRVARGRAA